MFEISKDEFNHVAVKDGKGHTAIFPGDEWAQQEVQELVGRLEADGQECMLCQMGFRISGEDRRSVMYIVKDMKLLAVYNAARRGRGVYAEYDVSYCPFCGRELKD